MQSQKAHITRRLKSYYGKTASKMGLGLTPSCCTLIERMINNGIDRMQSQGALDREEQIMVAERNLSRYLRKLSEEAQSQGTFPKVGAKTFDNVFNLECPVWPFC